MLKLSHFLGEDETGPRVIPLFGPADPAFEKTASVLLPEVVTYIGTLRPRTEAQYVLVNAMGASEYYGSNINGDAFTEASLIHRPDDWTKNPLIDAVKSKSWPYGYPTFYDAYPYAHHRNKDPSRAFGEVELAAWNDHMKRVELVIRLDKDKCDKFGATGVWDKIKNGGYPDVSMGCKVPFDTCCICLNWDEYRKGQANYDKSKHKHPGEAVLELHKKLKAERGYGIRGVSITRADYCEHAKNQMSDILPGGKKVWVFNDYPKFFDISFVFIGADRTAKTMMKIADGGTKVSWNIGGSAEIAEKLGYVEDLEKVAYKLQGHIDHQGLPIAVENRKGSVRSGVDKDGKPWRTEMKHPYGYIQGTKGKDGEEVDAYVGPVKDAPVAYVVHQHKENGKGFDEDKVMLGFASREEAEKAFLQHYDDPKYLGPISEVPIEKLKDLVESKEKLWKISSVEEALKLAFLGKLAKTKGGEITKDVVPSQFARKAIPALTANEKDLPKDVLNALGCCGPASGLATSGSMGMILRPREFQRVILVSLGLHKDADNLEKKDVVFPRSKDTEDFPLNPKDFHSGLGSLLAPFIGGRSMFGPVIEHRVVIMAGQTPEKRKEASSLSSDLLLKIGAAYNGYRRSVMDLIAHSQPVLESSGIMSDTLAKLAAASVSEFFTPLSVAYLQDAFWDETSVGDTNNTVNMFTGVERGLPSRNT